MHSWTKIYILTTNTSVRHYLFVIHIIHHQKLQGLVCLQYNIFLLYEI